MRAIPLLVAAALALCACRDDTKPPEIPNNTRPLPGPSPTEPINGPDDTRSTNSGDPLRIPPQVTESSSEDSATDPDIRLTDQMRRAIAAIDDISESAKKVNINASSGRVTLRGQVKSETEHMKLLSTARRLVGDDKVDDQLTVRQ